MAIVPNLSIIAAMADNRVIGRDNRLPWHLPADLAHFKKLTMGKPMIMGRKTFESLPGLLPGRTHVVVTRNRDYAAEGAVVVHSLDEAIARFRESEEMMLVGGAELYAQGLPLAARMYLTLVHVEPEGDAWFPEFNEASWHPSGAPEQHTDPRSAVSCTFQTLQRAAVTTDRPM